MPRFDPLAILDRVNRMSDAEIPRRNAEWRALYGHLDPFVVAPFVEQHGQPLSAEGYRFTAAGQERPVTDNAGYPLRIGAISSALASVVVAMTWRRIGKGCPAS